MSSTCPLCLHPSPALFYQADNREFWRCPHCNLVYVSSAFCLSRASERAHYENHQNDELDSGYRRHLEKLALPLVDRLSPGERGLDFGSGAGRPLSRILKEHGHHCESYDLYFACDESLLLDKYDFITMTEVIEHLRAPRETLTQLLALMNPGATLAVMTQLYEDQIDFSSWYYKNDPTHISLFHPKTLEYLSEHFHLKLEVIARDVFFFKS